MNYTHTTYNNCKLTEQAYDQKKHKIINHDLRFLGRYKFK